MSLRHRFSAGLVRLACWIEKPRSNSPYEPQVWPYYRPVDTYMPGIGHKYSCGAYSYEGLKRLVEQDGPDGFGATATVKWLVSEDGWQDLAGMTMGEIRREFAVGGIDMDEDAA